MFEDRWDQCHGLTYTVRKDEQIGGEKRVNLVFQIIDPFRW